MGLELNTTSSASPGGTLASTCTKDQPEEDARPSLGPLGLPRARRGWGAASGEPERRVRLLRAATAVTRGSCQPPEFLHPNRGGAQPPGPSGR